MKWLSDFINRIIIIYIYNNNNNNNDNNDNDNNNDNNNVYNYNIDKPPDIEEDIEDDDVDFFIYITYMECWSKIIYIIINNFIAIILYILEVNI